LGDEQVIAEASSLEETIAQIAATAGIRLRDAPLDPTSG